MTPREGAKATIYAMRRRAMALLPRIDDEDYSVVLRKLLDLVELVGDAVVMLASDEVLDRAEP